MSERDVERAETEIRRRAKTALRKQMRAVRAALPESAVRARSREISARVLALPELREATTMLAFASIRNEVDTRPLVDAVIASGTRVAFPRVADDELTLHLVGSYDELVEGAFSVPEPPEDAARLQPQDVEFALVPALAVDSRGYRIGYGGGYYDRLVPTLSGALTCAIAYDFQLVAEVPEQPFDAAVDVIVTDARVIRSA